MPDETSEIVPEEARPDQGKPVTHRLTVVHSVYHQVHGGDATDVHARFDRDLGSDEQMYQRHTKVGTRPIPLPLGWVGEQDLRVAMVTIDNHDETHDITVQFDDSIAGLRVPSGEMIAFTPIHPEYIKLFAPVDYVKFTISVIPG